MSIAVFVCTVPFLGPVAFFSLCFYKDKIVATKATSASLMFTRTDPREI